MTDKQKEAMEILIRERSNGHLIDTDFYTLMDFVIGVQSTFQPSLIWPEQPHPLTYPWITYQNTPVDIEQLKFTTTCRIDNSINTQK